MELQRIDRKDLQVRATARKGGREEAREGGMDGRRICGGEGTEERWAETGRLGAVRGRG